MSRFLLVGTLGLTLVQLAGLLAVLVVASDYKGGLINARVLVFEGLQSWTIQWALLRYVMTTALMMLSLAVIALLAARELKRFYNSSDSQVKIGFCLLLLLYICLLVMNSKHYPASLLAFSFLDFFGIFAVAMYYFTALFALSMVVMAFYSAGRYVAQFWGCVPLGARIGGVIIASSIVAFEMWPSAQVEAKSTITDGRKPNIILVGLDSVRMDILRDEEMRRKYMPVLDAYLGGEDVAWFPNAWTPIARTFAAWYSMLSGDYPKTSGVRYNLQQLTVEQKHNTIVPLLVSQGYLAIYGSDEKRFSNIDRSYGFHDTIGPPPGGGDWIMSILEDTPTHNIARRLPVGVWFVPYTYANRASSAVYDPDNFVRLVDQRLAAWDRDQPLFLGLHLCLVHWPYTFGSQVHEPGASRIPSYFAALSALDEQFGALMSSLEDRGALENALIIVFSDHGEGLISASMMGDTVLGREFSHFLPDAFDRTSWHGTDVLTPSQNQVLISIKDRRLHPEFAAQVYDGVASLVDIAPTIARVVGEAGFGSDGFDLLEITRGGFNQRLVFMETGFNVEAMESVGIDISALVSQGASSYEFSETGLLQIRQVYHDKIVSTKQVGVTDGRFILGTRHSGLSASSLDDFLVVDLAIPSEYTSFENVEDLYQISMYESLIRFFGSEIYQP